jgi:hypothetical protein
MTAAVPPAPPGAESARAVVVAGPVTWAGVIHSEWIKLRSLRSTAIVLLLTVVVMVLFPVLIAAQVSYNPIDQGLFGVHFATFTIGILGVLVITGEYATGMILATVSAVPRRLPVLWAKAAVFALVVFSVTLMASLASFLAAQARYGSQGASISSPGALRAVLGAALFLTAMGLLGLAFGFLTRNTAGGITAVVGFTLVLSQGGDVLPPSWRPHVVPYLPFQAGEAAYTVPPYPSYAHELLHPWTGLAVVCGYVAVTTAAAAVALQRRDATAALRWHDRVRSLVGAGRRAPGSGSQDSAVLVARAEPLSPVVVGPVTQAGVIRSEWIKLRSVRSTGIVLACTAVLIAATGPIVAAATNWNTLSAAQRVGFDPIGQSLLGVHNFAGLPIGVLGALVITGEYTTGMIRPTFCAVPRRLPVLWAKAAILAPAVFAVILIASLSAFLGGQALYGRHGVSIAAPGAVRAVLGAALFLTVMGLFGMGLGFLTRSTAGGIVAVFGAGSVLQDLGLLLPRSWQPHVMPYIPVNAGEAVFAIPPYGEDMLHPWPGFAVFCGYAAAVIAGAAFTLRRRDA